ncbi:MAG: hypothetical protein IPP64_03245 [Bacteroidetes bacterium]|nr:hypothetical protein [Bacteroidota bacterium]
MLDDITLKWTTWKKFIFLFVLSYTFFYIFPFPFDAFPQLDFIFNFYDKLNDAFVIGIGKNIFHIQHLKKLEFSDSGDTTFDFLKFFISLILSIIAAVTLLLIDKKRPNYEKLQSYLFVYIRYCIGFYMLVYGFDKVFKSHFPFPSLEKLEQTFGESTPQGLLWAFMGYSTSYTIFLGIAEVCAGFLLLFRKTTALGALITLIIMINVAVINFSYDVPVKLFALHMVGYSFVLLYPFFNSIFQFFILQKESKLPQQPEMALPQPIQAYRKIIKAGVIVSFTLLFMNFSWTNMKTDGDSAPKPPLYGTYNYSGSNIKDGKKLKQIIFDRKNTLIKWEDSYRYYTATVDTIAKTVIFQSNSDPSDKRLLHYDFAENILTLSENDSSSIQFRKVDIKEYPLLNRGFHWVVEYPMNN